MQLQQQQQQQQQQRHDGRVPASEEVERVLVAECELARLRIKCAGILSRVLTLVDVMDVSRAGGREEGKEAKEAKEANYFGCVISERPALPFIPPCTYVCNTHLHPSLPPALLPSTYRWSPCRHLKRSVWS